MFAGGHAGAVSQILFEACFWVNAHALIVVGVQSGSVIGDENLIFELSEFSSIAGVERLFICVAV